MIASLPFKIERRLEVSRIWQFGSVFLAIGASAIFCAMLLATAGADVTKAFGALYAGAFGSWRATVGTLVKATPLILTACAVIIAFRAKIWNIGAEGQLFAGAVASYWAYTAFEGLPWPALFVVILLASFSGGALYGGFAGYLKARLSINEVLTTVMLNYIVRFFISYMLVEGGWRDPNSFYQQSPKIVEAAQYPLLIEGMRLHLGFVVAVLAAIAVYVVLFRTAFGYEIRAVGSNPRAALIKGINVKRTVVVVMLISGGLAGLAGAGELFGLHHRLKPDISTGFGFTGIIIAMLAGLHPLAAIVAAVLFGGLVNGGIRMQIIAGVPTALISAIEAIVLIFFLIAALTARYEVKRTEQSG